MTPRLIADPRAAPAGLERVCAFTLGTALAWLGHNCTGGCPTLASTVRASCWISHSRDRPIPDSAVALLLVDLIDLVDSAEVAALLDQVNDCTRPDRIRVLERRR